MPQFSRDDGFVTNYTVSGQGPAIIFIHGVGSRLQAWNKVVDHISDGYTCVQYDLRGFGQSSKPHGEYDIGMFTDDFVALRDHLGLGKVHVVGFSLGGLIAQSIAINRPDVVDRLALISTFAGTPPDRQAALLARAEVIRNSTPGEHYKNSLDNYFTKEFQLSHPEVIAEAMAASALNDLDCFAEAYKVIGKTDFGDRLREIAASTLVATGEHDGGQPKVDYFCARIPQSQGLVWPGLRHSVLAEAPYLVGPAIRQFLDAP